MADEEEDEDVCDSWEDMADSGELERRMEERNKLQMKKESKVVPTSDVKVPVVIQDDNNRTQYKPQLRILKRPDSGKDKSQSGQEKNEGPVRKSLAERQAEYAEARARIMGSACEGEELTASEEEKSESPFKASYLLKTSDDKTSVPENVIRQPLGPDGTKGFQIRR